MKSVCLALLSLVWVVLAGCAYHFWHWGSAECLFMALPGVLGFVISVVFG